MNNHCLLTNSRNPLQTPEEKRFFYTNIAFGSLKLTLRVDTLVSTTRPTAYAASVQARARRVPADESLRLVVARLAGTHVDAMSRWSHILFDWPADALVGEILGCSVGACDVAFVKETAKAPRRTQTGDRKCPGRDAVTKVPGDGELGKGWMNLVWRSSSPIKLTWFGE